MKIKHLTQQIRKQKKQEIKLKANENRAANSKKKMMIKHFTQQTQKEEEKV